MQPSNEGIISVSDNGDETPAIPVKRPRKSRRAAAEPELTPANEAEPEMVIEVEPDYLEPPIKKPRPKSKSVVVEIEQSPAKKSRVGKQPTIQVEKVDRGAEARLKVEPAVELPTPVCPYHFYFCFLLNCMLVPPNNPWPCLCDSRPIRLCH